MDVKQAYKEGFKDGVKAGINKERLRMLNKASKRLDKMAIELQEVIKK